MRCELKPGQNWPDVEQESQLTRIQIHEWLDWWMREAAELYVKLERAQALLHNADIKRTHAITVVNSAFRKCHNANGEVQFLMKCVARLNKYHG